MLHLKLGIVRFKLEKGELAPLKRRGGLPACPVGLLWNIGSDLAEGKRVVVNRFLVLTD